jgi:glycerol-3-phosphate dehydrogenase (NAD(P)+)
MKKKICVIGAGAWGTALANTLSNNKSDVVLVANKKEIADEINLFHRNKFLPNIKLSHDLRASTDIYGEIINSDFIFIVVPSSAVLDVLQKIRDAKKINKNFGLVMCSKGLEHSYLKLFHSIIEEMFEQNYAILSGPNFAIEVANLEPTITTIASKNKDYAEKVAKLLKNDFLKTEVSDDVLTAEISSIVKNIIAISCGMIDGFLLGQNTKSALVVQGVREILILRNTIEKTKNPEKSLIFSSGFGDIFLTCGTTKSRNNALGFEIAKGKNYSEMDKNQKTIEGALSAVSIAKFAKKLGIKLPLCETIGEILQENYTVNTIKQRLLGVLQNQF